MCENYWKRGITLCRLRLPVNILRDVCMGFIMTADWFQYGISLTAVAVRKRHTSP